jgi:hypothetical protein
MTAAIADRTSAPVYNLSLRQLSPFKILNLRLATKFLSRKGTAVPLQKSEKYFTLSKNRCIAHRDVGADRLRSGMTLHWEQENKEEWRHGAWDSILNRRQRFWTVWLHGRHRFFGRFLYQSGFFFYQDTHANN